MAYLMMGAAVVLLVLIFMGVSRLSEKRAEKSLKTFRGEGGKVEFVRCPVCETPLKKGENLHSRIFRPMNTPDQRMMVQGCPNCFPAPKNGAKRRCPVCGKSLGADGELVARLFNRSDTKKHVMILGCTGCMKVRSENL